MVILGRTMTLYCSFVAAVLVYFVVTGPDMIGLAGALLVVMVNTAIASSAEEPTDAGAASRSMPGGPPRKRPQGLVHLLSLVMMLGAAMLGASIGAALMPQEVSGVLLLFCLVAAAGSACAFLDFASRRVDPAIASKPALVLDFSLYRGVIGLAVGAILTPLVSKQGALIALVGFAGLYTGLAACVAARLRGRQAAVESSENHHGA